MFVAGFRLGDSAVFNGAQYADEPPGDDAGHHFERVPATRETATITLREEDQIAGFYGGGFLWAEAGRDEPLA